MSANFNPYHEWLGIPEHQLPPTYYRLLGLENFESSLTAISNGADRAMAFIRTFQTGPHSAESQQLLNEIAAARVCLLNPDRKTAYDDELRLKLDRTDIDPLPSPPIRTPAQLPPAQQAAPSLEPLVIKQELPQESLFQLTETAKTPSRKKTRPEHQKSGIGLLVLIPVVAAVILLIGYGMINATSSSRGQQRAARNVTKVTDDGAIVGEENKDGMAVESQGRAVHQTKEVSQADENAGPRVPEMPGRADAPETQSPPAWPVEVPPQEESSANVATDDATKDEGKASGEKVTFLNASAQGQSFTYVFDRSASMESRPLRVAKTELVQSLRKLKPDQQFQLIFYHHEVLVFSPGQLKLATDRNIREAVSFIAHVAADGGTNHKAALMAALKQRTDVVFFMTDADEPPMTDADMEEIHGAAAETQIHVIQLGVGPSSGNENFLVKVARQNGGEYQYIDTNHLRN